MKTDRILLVTGLIFSCLTSLLISCDKDDIIRYDTGGSLSLAVFNSTEQMDWPPRFSANITIVEGSEDQPHGTGSGFDPIEKELTIKQDPSDSTKYHATEVVEVPVETYLSITITAFIEGETWSGNGSVQLEEDVASTLEIVLEPLVVVNFPDASLEQAVRNHIGVPSGRIYVSMVDTITTFNVDNKNISDLTGMEYMTSVSILRLYLNNISDLSPLANLTALNILSLGSNNISDITPLSNLTELIQLYLVSNNISDISPLSNLTALTELMLDSNNISELSPLSNFTALTLLCLKGNDISDLSSLSNLTSLAHLELTGNNISDLSPLTNLSALRLLSLDENNISDLSPLSNLTTLNYLSLSFNNVSDLSPLSNMTVLFNLYLRNNNISDILPLVDNTGLDEAFNLYLEDNPLSATSINDYIPQLEARGVTVTY